MEPQQTQETRAGQRQAAHAVLRRDGSASRPGGPVATPDEGVADWPGDPRWHLLERILATPDFLRSPRLAAFLRYISRAALEGRSGELSEQHIGEVVFGRARNYDSSADTIVRSHALRLRRRLEQYVARAGKADELRLEIPRGGYVPLFVPVATAARIGDLDLQEAFPLEQASAKIVAVEARPTPFAGGRNAAEETREGFTASSVLRAVERENGLYRQAEPAAAPRLAASRSPETLPRHPQSWVRYRTPLSLGLLVFVLLAAATASVLYEHSKSSRLEAHHALWSRLFTRDQPTRIVLGDSGLVLFHAVTWQYVSLQDYLSDNYSHQMESVQHVEPGFAEFLRGRRYTSMVDAATLGHLLRLPQATPDRTLVQYARDMRLNDFKSGNLILMGAQEADPWVELFEKHMDFVFTSNTPDRHAGFLNRRPGSGEQPVYLSSMHRASGRLYAVVAFMPNLSGTGNVLLLEGTNMAGTESAVDLAMDDQHILPMLEKLRRPDGSLPYFEMLLQCDTLKDSAEPARVIAVHTHPF